MTQSAPVGHDSPFRDVGSGVDSRATARQVWISRTPSSSTPLTSGVGSRLLAWMSAFETLAALLTLAAVFAYVNHRWIRQPASIALMAMTLVLSIVLLAGHRLGWVHVEALKGVLDRIDFDDTLLHGMLGALLFAGALHIRLDDLKQQRLAVSHRPPPTASPDASAAPDR